jgi:hypothetical protein
MYDTAKMETIAVLFFFFAMSINVKLIQYIQVGAINQERSMSSRNGAIQLTAGPGNGINKRRGASVTMDHSCHQLIG